MVHFSCIGNRKHAGLGDFVRTLSGPILFEKPAVIYPHTLPHPHTHIHYPENCPLPFSSLPSCAACFAAVPKISSFKGASGLGPADDSFHYVPFDTLVSLVRYSWPTGGTKTFGEVCAILTVDRRWLDLSFLYPVVWIEPSRCRCEVRRGAVQCSAMR